jgi:hypothetical protein
MNAPEFPALPQRDPVSAADLPASVPAITSSRLGQLRLTPEDLCALRRQGWIQREWRGNRQVYKLRFRRGGKQIVRYLGDAEIARQVGAELAVLQKAHRACRRLRRIAETARDMLRTSKKDLLPLLARNGYRFHGLAIRRRKLFTNEAAAGVPVPK